MLTSIPGRMELLTGDCWNMLLDALRSKGSVAILVVTADEALSYGMRDLKEDGYTILSAVEDLATVPAVVRTSDACWVWKEMEQGAPYRRRFPMLAGTSQ